MRSGPSLYALALALVGAACSEANNLPPANVANAVDTLTVYAIEGTPVWRQSGYSSAERRPVRLDQSTTVDFAYELLPSGRRILLLGAMIGQPGVGGINPGLLPTDKEFGAIEKAEVNGYLTLDTVEVAPGDVFYHRGRISPSCYLGVPVYGKMAAIDFDDEARTMRFQVLVNSNCGYKSLTTGFPKN